MSDELMNAPMAGLLQTANAQIFEDVDDILQRSLAIGDPLIAIEYAQGLQKESLIKGLAIAKLMYKLKSSWNLFEVAGIEETFESMVECYNGYKPATLEKYIRMWGNIFENPDLSPDLKNQLSGRPVGDLLLLSAAARDGSLTSEDWEKVTIAPDSGGVRDIVRKARGDVTSSKNALIPKLQTREGQSPRGTLFFYYGEQKYEFGMLDIDNKDEAVLNMIGRFINRLGIGEV